VAILLTLSDYLLWQGGTGWEALPDGSYRYVLGSLGSGETGAVSFQATVAAGTPADDPTLGLRAEAVVSGAAADTDPYDNRNADVDILCGPDLAVIGLAVEPPTPTRGQALTLRVQVANVGVDGLGPYATTAGAPDVRLEVYVKQAVSPPPIGPLDHLGGYCANSGCSSARPAYRQVVAQSALAPGQSLTVVFPALERLSAGVYDIYAQLDTEGDVLWGGYREGNEENNLFSLRRFFVADLIFGPIVLYLPSQGLAASF
jgi:hypothetical protein